MKNNIEKEDIGIYIFFFYNQKILGGIENEY